MNLIENIYLIEDVEDSIVLKLYSQLFDDCLNFLDNMRYLQLILYNLSSEFSHSFIIERMSTLSISGNTL